MSSACLVADADDGAEDRLELRLRRTGLDRRVYPTVEWMGLPFVPCHAAEAVGADQAITNSVLLPSVP